MRQGAKRGQIESRQPRERKEQSEDVEREQRGGPDGIAGITFTWRPGT